jgi:DnaD/phage-associated family protein
MKTAIRFSGFPDGKTRIIPVPSLFFTEVLHAVDHLGELKLTLFLFWAIARQRGRYRYLRLDALRRDTDLMHSLAHPGVSEEEAFQEALERAIVRGTVLKASIDYTQGTDVFLFLNTARGRAAVRAVAQGRWRPAESEDEVIDLRLERPTVFTLYEQNIGPLTPMVADMLREAENSYPAAWIEDAIRIAVENNARKWSYVQAILEGWLTKGRDEREDRRDTEEARRRYIEGEYSDFIEH